MTSPVRKENISDAMEKIVHQLTRFIISVNQGNTIYSKARLLQQVKNIQAANSTSERIKFDTLHKQVNITLKSLYNMELLKLDDKSFMLLRKDDTFSQENIDDPSNTGAEYEKVMNEILLADSKQKYLQNYEEVSKLYAKNTDIMDDGVLCVVLCLIILKKNRVLESELQQDMLGFGIGSSSSKSFLEFEQIMARLLKLEYVQKENEFYSIGRRTKLEFDLFSLTMLIKEMFNLTDEQIPHYENSIKLLVGETYE